MEMTYKNLKTRDRFFNRALRRNLQKVSFIFPEYEDALIVVFDFYPISVFRLLKMSYWEMFDAYECPTKEMKEVDEFFENRLIYVSKDNLMKPFDCGYSSCGYGESSPCLELDCNRAYVYRWFKLAFIKERRISANPVYLFKEKTGLRCIRVNNKKLKNYDELAQELKSWFQKIKDATDEDRLKAGRQQDQSH